MSSVSEPLASIWPWPECSPTALRNIVAFDVINTFIMCPLCVTCIPFYMDIGFVDFFSQHFKLPCLSRPPTPPHSTLVSLVGLWLFLLLHDSQRLIIWLTAYGLSTLRRQTGPENSHFPLVEVLPNTGKTLGNCGNWLRRKEGWWCSPITDQFHGGKPMLKLLLFSFTCFTRCVEPILVTPLLIFNWV